MKLKTGSFSALFTAALVFGRLSSASAAAIITFDENGNGSINFGSGPTFITGSLQQDPGPGGQSSALTYVLNAPNLTAGDLLLNDAGKISDVIRFNPAGSGGDPNYLSSVVFYSSGATGFDSIADTTQPPLANYTNVLTIPEINLGGSSGAQYTPTSGQPGYVSGFAVTYDITSDTPEPASILLTLSGALFLAGRRIKLAGLGER